MVYGESPVTLCSSCDQTTHPSHGERVGALAGCHGQRWPGGWRLSSASPSRGCDGKWGVCALGPQFLSVKWGVSPVCACGSFCSPADTDGPTGLAPT